MAAQEIASFLLYTLSEKVDNRLIFEKLHWKPRQPLREGMEKKYKWIEEEVRRKGLTTG